MIVRYDGRADERGVGIEALVQQRKDDTCWLYSGIIEVGYGVLNNLNMKWMIYFIWNVKGFLQRKFHKQKKEV